MDHTITLVPNSSLQFYDLDVRTDGTGKTCSFVQIQSEQGLRLEGVLPFQDTEFFESDAGEKYNGEDTESFSLDKACKLFEGEWLPIPMFRNAVGANTDVLGGPSNWVRGHIGPLKDPTDSTQRDMVLVFDTSIDLSDDMSESYSSPTISDVRATDIFSIPTRFTDIEAYVASDWVGEWLDAIHTRSLQKKRQHSSGFLGTEEDLLEERLQLRAAYVALLRMISMHNIAPKVRFVDTISRNANQDPIEVDFVLDIGNSRSCGIIVERMKRTSANLNNSRPVSLRSLSSPNTVFNKPFPSTLEFSRPFFGSTQLSRKSGRFGAFEWPSSVRVGWEANRLSFMSEGTGGNTGMSSPKRYLWSDAPEPQEWRFNRGGGQNVGTANASAALEPATNSDFFARFTADGRYIPDLENSVRAKGEIPEAAVTANFSRSSLMTFLVIELILQVFSSINSPGARRNLSNADQARELKRIIMTLPTAMTKPEREILRARVDTAIDELWRRLGTTVEKPKVFLQWDEATATQAVFLYNEVLRSKSASSFFSAAQKNKSGEGENKSLRIASLDIGGGTTDLIVTRYELQEDEGLQPTQEFREGFQIAGDDILKSVIEQHVIGTIKEKMLEAGVNDAEKIVRGLFAGDYGGQSQQERTQRQQFAAQVLNPIGLALIGAHETHGLFVDTGSIALTWDEIFKDGPKPTDHVIDYLEKAALAAGSTDFALEEIEFSVAASAITNTIQRILEPTISCLSEVIYQYDCDFLLLAGRPSRFPAIRSLLLSRLPVNGDRLVCMHDYSVDNWYPYREAEGKIGDPKTCAAVGAMVCALSEGLLESFYMRSSALYMKSTARFIGKIEGNQMPDKSVLFRDVDLDDPNLTVQNVDVPFFKKMPLGFRQLEAERWPATMLYAVEFRDPEKASSLSLPLRVTLGTVGADELAKKNSKLFEVHDVTPDREGGAAVNRSTVQIKLQTMLSDGEHWLDTGIFNV
jgi:hypothetical protein